MAYDRMRELREDRDWTQQHVADLLFINRRTYSAYENGVNAMSPEILVKLSEMYQTSVDYLLGLTDEKKPYPKKRAL
ncbi:MAG: helix-turn-helix domain-containing protein [bacterium]